MNGTQQNQSFEYTLNMFRQYYLDYKVTGSPSSKIAYEGMQKWLDTHIQSLQKNVDDKGTQINTFVTNYQQSNPELVKMQGELKNIREQAPKLKDQYETEKTASEVAPRDLTPYYTKAAIFGGLLALMAVASMT